jgi:hypothetical protein
VQNPCGNITPKVKDVKGWHGWNLISEKDYFQKLKMNRYVAIR